MKFRSPWQNTGEHMRWGGLRQLLARPVLDGEGQTNRPDAQNRHGHAGGGLVGQALNMPAGRYDAPPENKTPQRQAITRGQRRRKSFWRGLFYLPLRLYRRFFPEPTPEEKRLREEMKRRKAAEKARLADIRLARRIITRELTRMGFCLHRTSEKGGVRVLQTVRLGMARANDQEIIFRVTDYPMTFDQRVTALKLVSDEVVSSLSERVGKPVYGTYDENHGARFFIALAGADGLPRVYDIGQMLDDFPSTAPPLALPIGVITNGRPLVRDLAEIPHVLVAGATGGGKSNWLHAVICTLITRNTPDRLQIDLLDFKDQGLEFSIYDGLPHLRTGAIVHQPERMDEYFRGLVAEMNRRYGLLKKAGKRSIAEYNRRRQKNRLPYLVVFVDELAALVHTLGQKKVDQYVGKIAQQGRAAGVHLVVATQYPKADVVSTGVTMNMQGRLAFAMPTREQSRVVINSGHASDRIPPDIPGRAIWYRGAVDEHIVQTPLITTRQIRQMVAAALEGRALETPGVALDPEELIAWALEDNFNRLDYKTTWAKFRERGISFHDLVALLKSLDGQVYEVNGVDYRVVPGVGNVPRHVEVYTEPDEEPETAPAAVETAQGAERRAEEGAA